MTVLSAQSITNRLRPMWPANLKMEIEPFHADKHIQNGMSYGLTAAGYDIRIGSVAGIQTDLVSRLIKPHDFILCASLERFKIPHDIQAIVHDKSSWARRGIALQNTVLEPGWEGYITLELSNHGPDNVRVSVGDPIAQVVFHQLDQPTVRPYQGKYQNQGSQPVAAIHEK